MRRDQPRPLLEAEGLAGSVLREYARRTAPAEVERWLRSPGRRAASRRPSALAGMLAAIVAIWLLVHPPATEAPLRGGAGGTEGASGRELGTGGRRGHSGSAPTAAREHRPPRAS